ncbi:hypothetical protein ACIA7S_28460 [Streptomyces sp. NPDC051643]|uniref:hypothetical protein n=1 Tax=Streptomyces sp. NPDC051643 TaxID=3365665 RepID=UPI0037973DEB
MRSATDTALVPYITMREGEEAAPANLLIYPGTGVLYYADERPEDRDRYKVLWARCSSNPLDARQQPTGEPRWKFMHPGRQRSTMERLLCQVCAQPARTPLGLVFISAAGVTDPVEPTVLTDQPPVCARHIRTVLKLCPALEHDPMVMLATSAPLYGVHGVLYGLKGRSVEPLVHPDEPMAFAHLQTPTMLASKLVRRLSSFRVVDPDELVHNLAAAAA